jgi:hypothetical protein
MYGYTHQAFQGEENSAYLTELKLVTGKVLGNK